MGRATVATPGRAFRRWTPRACFPAPGAPDAPDAPNAPPSPGVDPLVAACYPHRTTRE